MFHRNKKTKNFHQIPLAYLCRRALLCFFILLSFIKISYAQYYVSGDNRGTIEYRQIKTDKFHIVYPHYYENNAQILARILDTLVPVVGNTISTTPERTPILIHSRSSKSNGLTVWAPSRMEFWTTTPPNTYSYPYLWQLAIHEYRHTSQMSSIRSGLTKSLSKVFGEHITGAVAGIWLTNWFLEGDAVVSETSLAPTGRGQTPEYNMYLKAELLDKGGYSTDKMLLGSMRDFVPDEYNLGYFLVSYARKEYGKDIWGKYLKHIGNNWWHFFNLNNTVKKNVSLDFDNLYKETINYLEDYWKENDKNNIDNIKDSVIKHWTDKKKYYCNYLNPVQINDSTLLALKTSQYDVQTLVQITNDKETTLLRLPYLLHSSFDYKDGHILYAQYSPSIRWQQESASDIIEYDLNSNKYRRVTFDATLFTPIFYPSDSIICAIMTDDLDNQSLSIIAPDAEYFKNRHFGKKIKSSYLKNISFDYTVAFSYPAWEDESGDIFLIVTDTKGKSIMRYDRDKETFNSVTDFSYDNMKYLKVYKDRLYFVKDINNKYQLLSININNYNDVQIHTNSRYGIDNYCVYDSTIVVSDYTCNGYELVSLPYTSRPWNLEKQAPTLPFTKSNREQENFILTKEIIDKDIIFPSKKYNKLTHLFDFHSWAPVYVNIKSQEVGMGISAMSQNLLSSSVLEAGFLYHIHDKNKLYLHHTYSGLYPIFDLTTSYRPRDINRNLDSNVVQYLNWDEFHIEEKITLPFTWVNRNFYNNMNFAFYYTLDMITDADRSISKTTYNSVGYELTSSHYAAKSQNDLFPRWGVIARFKWLNTLTSDKAYIFATSAQIFFPGLMKNHSLVLTANLQHNTPEVYYFPNEVSFVRGVYDLYPEKFYGLLACYHFPLLYPDSGIQGYLYIKRIVARPFFNIGSYDKEVYKSFGTDLEAKVHIFRITVPVNFGFRIGYVPRNDDVFAHFLFSIDI
ncbi:MAG: hypothetical protein IJ213_09275 [Bacteroidales bacterium]|nr:hypothetical protein [Bacteroidales bacterium]